MAGHEKLPMGRKAESIYTAVKRNRLICKKQKAVLSVRSSVDSFEEHIRKNAASKACYVPVESRFYP